MSDLFPQTVDAAVRLLTQLLPKNQQAAIAAMPQEDLHLLHFALGRRIRDVFGLWSGNPTLLRDAGTTDPDDASSVIILALWLRLRENLPKLH